MRHGRWGKVEWVYSLMLKRFIYHGTWRSVPASVTRPEVSAKLGGVGVWGLRLPLAGTLVAPSGLSSR